MADTMSTLEPISHVIMDTGEKAPVKGLVWLLTTGVKTQQHAEGVLTILIISFLHIHS